MEFDDLPLFRVYDPVTSQQGAAHIRPKVGSQIHTLLAIYRNHIINGLTDEEACTRANLTVGGWKRCSDLRRLALIETTGTTRTARSGVEQRVCRITPKGLEALQ